LISSSDFQVSNQGEITASAGLVGGWNIHNTSLSGGDITLDSNGNILAGYIAITGSDSKITKNDDYLNYFLDFATPEFKLGNYFHLTTTGLSLSGSITASAGNIGG